MNWTSITSGFLVAAIALLVWPSGGWRMWAAMILADLILAIERAGTRAKGEAK